MNASVHERSSFKNLESVMINPMQFLSILGVSFFGTFGAIILFWVGGIIRTNIVWFVSMLSMSMFDDSGIVASVQVQSDVGSIPVDLMNEVDSTNIPSQNIHPSNINVITRRSSAVRLNGVLGGLPIRPVAKIHSDADRIRVRDSIRVCQLPAIHSPSVFESIVIERRYEPGPAPTSTIFGP
jgi:hypothetical protein